MALLFTIIFLLAYGPKTKKQGIRIFIIIGLMTFGAFALAAYLNFHLDIVDSPALFAVLYKASFLATGWMGMALILAVPLAILFLFRLIIKYGSRSAPPVTQESRRNFFRNAAIALPSVTFLGTTAMAVQTATSLKLNEKQIGFRGLPDSLDGYTVGQISDAHLGPYFSLADLENAFAVLKDKKVQRVFITGDLIDDIPLLPGLCEMLEKWFPQFPHGIDYIYGNHEHYRDLPAIERAFSKLKMRVLNNEHLVMMEGATPVYLAGVNYPFTDDAVKDYTEKALRNIPKGAFIIFLVHHPAFIKEAFERGIPFTLAGHTHGGQFNVGHVSLLPMKYEFWRDMYGTNEHDQLAYVSTGAGNWFPLRINCPREITTFTFYKGVDKNNYNEYT